MSRWTQTWLPGSDDGDDATTYRGEQFGRPAEGVGSVPGFWPRLGGLLVDWVPCTVLAQIATDNPALSQLALFALLTVVGLTFYQRTLGHAAFGLQVIKIDGTRLTFPNVMIRTMLLCLAIPPLITDSDGRGLHDRATGTLVVRTR